MVGEEASEMRRVTDEPLQQGHFIKTTVGTEVHWGKVVRLQDGMAMVRLQGCDRSSWFQAKDIREYYQKNGKEEALEVDANFNVRLKGNDLVMDAEMMRLRCQQAVMIDAESIQASGTHLNWQAPHMVLQTEDFYVGSTSGSALRLQPGQVQITGAALAVEGDLRLRGVSLQEALRRTEAELQALRQRCDALEAAAAAAPAAPASECSPEEGGSAAAAARDKIKQCGEDNGRQE